MLPLFGIVYGVVLPVIAISCRDFGYITSADAITFTICFGGLLFSSMLYTFIHFVVVIAIYLSGVSVWNNECIT